MISWIVKAMSRADNSGSNGKMASGVEPAASQNPTFDSTSSNGHMSTSIEPDASQNHSLDSTSSNCQIPSYVEPATSQNPCQQSMEEKQSAADMSSNQESEMQRLQDELVACKMREAEANLSMKEFEQKLNQLERHWQHFLCESRADNDGKSPSQPDLKETVMGLRLRETHLVSGMNDLKQSLMELETQNHIYERQIKRQEAEQATLLETISAAEAKERELINTISHLERKVSNMESRCQEDAAMSRIREAEYSQTIAEMRRRIAELEIENQELLTSAKLHNRDSGNSENGVAELQDDELGMAAPGFRQLISAPEDDDDDDDDDIVATNSFSRRFHDTDMFDLPNMSQLAKDNLLMTSSFVEHISHSDIDSSFAEQFGSHADTGMTASLDDSQTDSGHRQAEDGS